jgi:hypothetical protein
MNHVRRLLSAIATAALAIAVLSRPAAAQAPKPMSEAAVKAAGGQQIAGPSIRQMNVGNTSYALFLKSVTGLAAGTVVPIFHRDGRHRAVRLANGQKSESIWWIDGNAYCNEQRIVNVGHQCYTIWELSGTQYSCLQPAGECFISNRIVPGNPENL